MGHVVKRLPWCTIDINTVSGQIFLQQRWLYEWLLDHGASEWKYKEKRAFHNTADRLIWSVWSNRAKLKVTGTSPFAKSFAGKKLPINFDIQWVFTDEHWVCKVTKVPPKTFIQSEVLWNARVIKLDSNDFVPKSSGQIPAAHEYGHTVGNTWVLNRGDEYKPTSPWNSQTDSIMNLGHKLYERHFLTVLEEMNGMIPDATFAVDSIK